MSSTEFSQIVSDVLAHQITKVSLIILGALLLSAIMRRVIDQVIKRMTKNHKYGSSAERRKRQKTLASAFMTLGEVIIWTGAFSLTLTTFNVNITALLTGAGLVGIIVGFGAQNAIKDILAGIFIILENQYRVGDIVVLNAGGKDVSGVVEDLTVRITKLRDLDGNLHIVKNGSAEVVSNLSFRYANVNINVSVAYESDIDAVEARINAVGQALATDPTWQEHIIEPIAFLRVDGFEQSGIRIKALGKVKPAEQWAVSGEFLRRIKKDFDAHGIEIPFNQVVVRQRTPKK